MFDYEVEIKMGKKQNCKMKTLNVEEKSKNCKKEVYILCISEKVFRISRKESVL